MKKPSTAEYTPISTAYVSWVAIWVKNSEIWWASVCSSTPFTWVRMAAIEPYSGNWISTPVVVGTARVTASRKLRGRQCSKAPSMMNSRL
ncbi:hypothetical protein D3C71_1796060 [compost metagenome]